MPQEGKPEVASDVTTSQGNEVQQSDTQTTANPSVEVSKPVSDYLKGLGLDSSNATADLIKVAEAGMKQKANVSKMSLEKEQLLARLSSMGKDTSEPVIEEKQTETNTPEPEPQVTEAKIGVSDNDLFDLARMINSEFKDLSDSAQDGSLFRELRQLGYFTSQGINKKAVYDYLDGKNKAAKELRELREFKNKYEHPDPNSNPVYNQRPAVDPNANMTNELARSIVLSGDTKNSRYQEAVAFMRKGVIESGLRTN